MGVAEFPHAAIIPTWEAWCKTVRDLTGCGPKLFRIWAVAKARFTDLAEGIDQFMNMGSLFYLRNLAQSRGFGTAVKLLDKVWERAMVCGFGSGPEAVWGGPFQVYSAIGGDFSFKPFQSFARHRFSSGTGGCLSSM